MIPYLPPAGSYRYSLKEGMRGHEVYALQVLLNQLTTGATQLTEDGVFGSLTASKVRGMQKTDRLVIDGVAGPATQKALARRALKKLAKSPLGYMPAGLMEGLIVGESGYIIGCVNDSISGGIDAGLIQDRVYTSEYQSTARWRVAFGYESILAAAGDIVAFYEKAKATKRFTDRRCWELAVLNHNWPYGADQLLKGNKLSTADATWVINIGVKGVTTPAQWAEFYIAMTTTLVVW